MPFVSEEFVKNAQALAKGVPALQVKLLDAEKKAAEQKPTAEKEATEKAAAKKLNPLIEATVNTLVEHGLLPANEKAAAIAGLKSHEDTLQALNKTAQQVKPEAMDGSTQEKVAGTGYQGGTRGDEGKESDRFLLGRLGWNV